MNLPEQMILLLAACDLTGSQRARTAVGAAGLSELLLGRRIRIEGWSRLGVQMKRFAIIDRSPAGDKAIDAMVAFYADLPNRRRLLYYTVPKIGDHFLSAYADKARKGPAAEQVLDRVRRVLLMNGPADVQVLVLAAIVHGAGLAPIVVRPADLKKATRTGRSLMSGASGVAAAVGPNIAAEEDLTEELVDFAREVLNSVDFSGDGDGGDDSGGAF